MFGFACILSVLGNPARRQITARSRTLFYKGGPTMKVTVLMENTAPAGCALAPEHGLSFWIETGEQTILLDAGASGQFADNAAKLGVDLDRADFAVLSHGHRDHANGLGRFFAANAHAPVYLRTTAPAPLYAKKPAGYVFVGMDRAMYQTYQDRFIPVDGFRQLADNVWLVPKTVADPQFDSREATLLQKRGEDDYIPDDFSHEHALVFRQGDHLIVFSSCSHGGIVNIVRSVQQQLDGLPVKTVLGGFHMYSPGVNDLNCPPEYVRSVARELKSMGVEQVWTGHCTGPRALSILEEELAGRAAALTTGLQITL